MYNQNFAKNLKIGVINDSENKLTNFLQNFLFAKIKIHRQVKLEITNLWLDSTNKTSSLVQYNSQMYAEYNFLFYLCDITMLKNAETVENLKIVSLALTLERNHLFIFVDNCQNMDIDDEGDLFFNNKEETELLEKFNQKLRLEMSDKLYHICKLSISDSIIYQNIITAGSIVNLNEAQINQLVYTFLNKKVQKLAFQEKKKEVRNTLKKHNLEDLLIKTGYNEALNNIEYYFKIARQKKIVVQNYLFLLQKMTFEIVNLDFFSSFLKEVYQINYLKSEMHIDLLEKIEVIILQKVKNYFSQTKNNVVLEPVQICHIDAYTWNKFLIELSNISKTYNLANVLIVTKTELAQTSNLIINYHKKEMEKVTDLVKIASFLQIFANKDKNNLISLFDKIFKNTKIITENIEKMELWVKFIDECFSFGIPKESILRLLEELIISKVTYYSDISRTNKKDLSVIYPQCLSVFLLSNLNVNFLMKKLHMFVSYSIRYSGRNIADCLRSIKSEDFDSLLILENKLLEICTVTTAETSQFFNLSDLDIIETFNENSTTGNTDGNAFTNTPVNASVNAPVNALSFVSESKQLN